MPEPLTVGGSRGTLTKRAERDNRSAWDAGGEFDAAALAEKLRSEADRFLRERPPERAGEERVFGA
jgi:hypothetical protein